MKIISRAEAKEQGLKFYFTGKECSHGHISERLVSNGRCLACNKAVVRDYKAEHQVKKERGYYDKPEIIEQRRAYARKYHHQNREARLEKQKKWRQKNIEKMKQYRKDNAEKQAENRKRWRAQNPDRYKKVTSADNKKWRQENRLDVFVRNTVKRIEGYKGKLAVSKYEEILGYTQAEFIAHIESQFEPGMDWDNRNEWHIDHIYPIAQFIKDGVTDIKIINALSNLRPMWAQDNLSKGAKVA